MTKEKNLDASKQADKFANELLNDDELDNVAGGTGSEGAEENVSHKLIQNLFGSAGSRENQDPPGGYPNVSYK